MLQQLLQSWSQKLIKGSTCDAIDDHFLYFFSSQTEPEEEREVNCFLNRSCNLVVNIYLQRRCPNVVSRPSIFLSTVTPVALDTLTYPSLHKQVLCNQIDIHQ